MIQVRDFDFCPDDGRITRMVIDALGIPAVPRRLLASQGVQMQLVQRATWSSITLYPGAEANIEKLTTGIFDSAINLLKVQTLSVCTAAAITCLHACCQMFCCCFHVWMAHRKYLLCFL